MLQQPWQRGSAVFSALGCSKKPRASPPPPPPPSPFLSPPPYWWDSCQWRMRCKWTSLLIRGDAFCILVQLTFFAFDFQSSSFGRFRAESGIPNAPANKTCKTESEREREREREREKDSCCFKVSILWWGDDTAAGAPEKQQGAGDQSALI